MTVGELTNRMSSSELSEWRALSLIRNEEFKRDELRRRAGESG